MPTAQLAPILLPVLALIAWSLIVFLWMYGTRIPAMSKAEVDPQSAKHPASLPGVLPSNVEAIADNYNHLMEQPTIFYATCFFLALSGLGDATAVNLAWAYVGLRVVHSLIQGTANIVMARFLVFTLSTIALIVMVVRACLAVL